MTGALLSEEDVREMLRERCKPWGAQTTFAHDAGCNRSYVALVLSGRAKPGPKIIKGLGLERVIRFTNTKRLQAVSEGV